RATPVQPANAKVLDQAAADAARPPPTAGQTATAVLDQAQQVADTGFSLLQTLLAAAGGIAGTWGAGKVARKITGLQTTAAQAQEKASETLAALGQVVGGIDRLPPEVKQQVKATQQQTAATQVLVTQAKAGG
ncbi:MAG TPA: hypothetical protein VMW52_05665, partial [Phycisphaerae bacterium]|nr:hypothetical protein [Phycisphaerae bacterium]